MTGMSWITDDGPLGDVVISSRIRLARNISGVKFPSSLDQEGASYVINSVEKSIMDTNSTLSGHFKSFVMKDLSPLDRNILVEKHLISPDLADKPDISAVMIDDREEISIMINEEDHIRMQSITPGFSLNDSWNVLDKIDDLIEENVPYAFDERLGYLTACPTNVGTGMRASVMMHLPGLVYAGQMGPMLQTISKIGLTLRGLYGEGSEALGNIYQMSNQVTLGPSEHEIINNINIVAKQIIEKERATRQALAQANGVDLDDNIWRAFGILRYAQKLNLKEFMALISQIRLGIALGKIDAIALNDINRIMIMAQPANIQRYALSTLKVEDMDVARAHIVREMFSKL
jgi:protein arginine kinase